MNPSPQSQSSLQHSNDNPSHAKESMAFTKQSILLLASETENREKGGRRLKNIRKRKLFAADAGGGRHNQPEKLGGNTKNCKLLPAAAGGCWAASMTEEERRTSLDGGLLGLYIMQQGLNPDGQREMKI